MATNPDEAAAQYASEMIKTLKAKAAENVDTRHLMSTPVPKTLNVMKVVKRNADMEYCDGAPASLRHAYQLYFRIVIIVLEKLPKHPQFSQGSATVRELRGIAADALEQAEDLKSKLKKQFVVLYKKRLQKQKELEQNKLDEEGAPTIETLEARLSALATKKGDRAALLAIHRSNLNLPSNTAQPSAFITPTPQLLQPTPTPQPPSVAVPRSPPKQLYPMLPDMPLEEIELSDKLRRVHLPGQLVTTFLQRAQANNDRNVETCGFLAGVLRNGELYTTALLIPKQSGQADSCEPLDDLDMFTYMESNNYIQLGWIHTHPSQTAFLSSVDLHTHGGFQMMLSEAIAIVCSVKFNDNKIFNLTTPHGLNVISSCRERGFHPHQQTGLFEVCGHVVTDPNLNFELKDWR
eukprot:m.147159 g.147159  ORF g.147159 m.147159 type:complete len:406 (+) comp30519_c9_seq4:298-1515(+)